MGKQLQIEQLRTGMRPPWPRTDLPHIAVAGRSNVGKSSLLNKMLGRKALAGVGKSPGKTRSLHFYEIEKKFVLCDLPGYGYAKIAKKMRVMWSQAIETYLQSETGPIAIVALIDGRHPPTDQDVALAETIDELELAWLPVLTKADKVPRSKRIRHQDIAAEKLGTEPEDLLWTSSTTGEGTRELLAEISRLVADL